MKIGVTEPNKAPNKFRNQYFLSIFFKLDTKQEYYCYYYCPFSTLSFTGYSSLTTQFFCINSYFTNKIFSQKFVWKR